MKVGDLVRVKWLNHHTGILVGLATIIEDKGHSYYEIIPAANANKTRIMHAKYMEVIA